MSKKPPLPAPENPFNFQAVFLTLHQVHKKFGVPRQKVYDAAKAGALRTHPDLGMTTYQWVLDWLGVADQFSAA